MRILHVIPSFAPAWRYGGPIVAALGMTKALARLGHDVTVFTTNIDGPNNLDVPNDHPVDLDGVKVHYLQVGRPRSYCYSSDLGRALENQIGDFDVVHIHSVFLWPTTAAASWCRRKGVPYVIRPAGMLSDETVSNSYLGGPRSTYSRVKKWSYIRTFGKGDLAGAAAVHFTSMAEAETSKIGGISADSWVIPLGVDVPEQQAIDSSYLRSKLPNIGHDPIVLFLSRIDPKKGLDILIRALAQLKDCRDFTLVIAGAGSASYEREIHRLVSASGLEDRTHFLGMVEGQDKWSVLTSADIFALPSHNENFGVAVVEAMASKLPVVISDRVALYSDVSDAKAGIVTNLEVDEVAAAIDTLLLDNDMRSNMGKAGKALASGKFSWEANGKCIVEMYESVIEKSGQRSAELTRVGVGNGE
jgi:glycosyltransferase involved in cell wall biosynthesis